MKIGVLHPGSMGAALAVNIDGEALWSSEGRSSRTAERASLAGMKDAGSPVSLVERADVIMSVCPPAAATEVARDVSRLAFSGVFVDANAVSPATARQIGGLFERYVDGGIIGPPPSAGDPVGTRLYLSGEEAATIAGLFVGSGVEARVVGTEPGRASALKMAFAAWTKGTSALLLAIAALADAVGVSQDLRDEWEVSMPGLEKRLEELSGRIGKKAWRFAGEMDEIAAGFRDAGLPGGFHAAASDVYARLAGLKGQATAPSPEEIVRLLLDAPDRRVNGR